MLTLVHRFRSDEALMQAYQRGDADAFECLYHRHKDGLFAFLYRSCPQMAVVEELAQEAWMAVVKRAPQYEAQGHFKTWLYQIGHNRLVDFWRRKDNQHESLENTPEPVANNETESANESRQLLIRAIAQLPGEQRDTLLLREQGFSNKEIAEITGSGEETIKSRLRYARKQLREHLGEAP
ncbi:MAG: RNA polymerase sigma-70 factor (ECF subfamily) [Halioglobus sp.]|jgi:RNA polymerase sigma-70 factor (ECF subfamily)